MSYDRGLAERIEGLLPDLGLPIAVDAVTGRILWQTILHGPDQFFAGLSIDGARLYAQGPTGFYALKRF